PSRARHTGPPDLAGRRLRELHRAQPGPGSTARQYVRDETRDRAVGRARTVVHGRGRERERRGDGALRLWAPGRRAEGQRWLSGKGSAQGRRDLPEPRPPGPLRRARGSPRAHAAFRERCWAWADLCGGRYRLDPELLTRPTTTTVLQEGPGVFLSGRLLFLTMIPRRTPYEGRRPGGQVLYRTRRAWRLDDT